MVAAKEAIRIAPNSAKATALLGDVHRRSIDGLDRARKAYEQSLRVDSSDAGVSDVSGGRARGARACRRSAEIAPETHGDAPREERPRQGGAAL